MEIAGVSLRVLNIFSQNLLFANSSNRHGEAKKKFSNSSPFLLQKMRSCGPTRIIPQERKGWPGGEKWCVFLSTRGRLICQLLGDAELGWGTIVCWVIRQLYD